MEKSETTKLFIWNKHDMKMTKILKSRWKHDQVFNLMTNGRKRFKEAFNGIIFFSVITQTFW